MLLGGFFLVLLVFLGFHLAQVQVTTGNVLELLAVVFVQVTHHPLVDTIRQDEYLDALLAEHFQVRAALGGREVVAGDVVDLFLAIFHAVDVVVQGDVLSFIAGMSRGKAQQPGDFLAVAEVFCRAFFQNGAELVPEALVFITLFLGQLRQHVQHPLGHGSADALHSAVVLQDFPRYVQGQVVGIDHTLGKTQVQRQELLGVVHDEYALNIQLQATGCFAVIQVKRRTLRDIQQAGVVQLAFHLVVGPGERVFEVVGDVLVELFVLFVLDLGAGQRPQGGGIVDRLVFALLVLFLGLGFHHDREGDVIRVLLHQAAQLPAIRKLFVFGFQVQHDFSTALFTAHRLDGELAIAFGLPMHTLFDRCTGLTGEHIHLVRHDEG